jgi:hypothetical protein
MPSYPLLCHSLAGAAAIPLVAEVLDYAVDQLQPVINSSSLTRCFTQFVRDPQESPSALLESVGHAREILRSRCPSPNRPTAEHVVFQAGIIGELPHGERPVAENALHEADNVFASQPHLHWTNAHKFVLTLRVLNTIL